MELDVGGTDFLMDDAINIFGVVEILGGGVLVVERMRDESLEGLCVVVAEEALGLLNIHLFFLTNFFIMR